MYGSGAGCPLCERRTSPGLVRFYLRRQVQKPLAYEYTPRYRRLDLVELAITEAGRWLPCRNKTLRSLTGLTSNPAKTGARIDIYQAPPADSALTIPLRVHLGRRNEISTSPSARFRSSLVCDFDAGDGLAIRRGPSHNPVKG